ncbi:DNA-processing protein DprA [Stutzerimonas stutzeri]|uniref:DNA-processing protein DprA n=1 Tax=Stutzerimonas stutzeri TaxID=316 RepID=UPI000F767432|nr:DNA-processing protein DprA [Stutzerimonas stutzeri]MDH0496974.1 DNA-processing protein DprA [Stutzerimonas stutzeri]RRW09050.1 DNA-protecting protein DprA [Stutzerimonas stutzeri]WGG16802.1 DNA-processing protein DprA [Stutzerimonas stutzeri]
MPAISPAELEARLRLHLLPELGPRRLQRLLSAFPDAASALSAPASAWRSLGLPVSCAEPRRSSEIRERASAALAWLQAPGRHVICWDDPAYPALLAELPDAPPLLFVAGDPTLLERPQLAVVGSRRASRNGLDNARAFSRSLAGAGFVITSGLALGIDGAAHQGALDANGKTVAVLGTGIERLYPQRHLGLAKEIVEHGGALVSELPLDCPPQASNFPRRNRIISGLSLGVLVVEASPSSGSLITARLAAEQGREVYAIPGSIHHPGARGCHQLIRQGAALVESVEDVLQALRGWQRLAPLADEASKPPQTDHPLLRELLAASRSSEALAAALDQPLGQVLAQLTELEIEGQVSCDNGLWSVLMR